MAGREPLAAGHPSVRPRDRAWDGARSAKRRDGPHRALWYSDADLRLTGASIPIDLSTGSATLSGESGLYRLTISGSWPSGEAGFSVAIRIGIPPSDWPPTPPIALVPDVVGLGQREAIALLTDAGFVSVSVAIPAGQNTGVVTSQDPTPGTRSDVTGTIKLTVSAND